MTTPQFMPAGFYIHERDSEKKKMRLVSFYGKQGNFQISKNSREVMIIGLDAVEHVDPPADCAEWNKPFEPLQMRTVTDIAQDAMRNFDKMSERMASIANGNSKHSRSWPCEEDLFPPLREYLNKNRELKKELERLYENVL